MGLDINTPKGQESLKQEQRALEIFSSEHPDVDIIQTDKTSIARIDGLLIKDSKLVGIFETKCRNMSLEDLQKYGTWMITYRKLRHGKEMAFRLQAPFFGILYLVPDDTVLLWQIADANGEYMFDFDTRKGWSQKTINGGKAFRENAYLPIDYVVKQIQGNE